MEVIDAQLEVKWWLQGEHSYQFEKNKRTHQGNPLRSLYDIVELEIPNKWCRFQFFREAFLREPNPRAHLQATQQLLKTTAAARAAFIWGGVAEGRAFADQACQSWAQLTSYQAGLLNETRVLPAVGELSLKECPVGTEVPATSRELGERFTYLSGLAVVHLMDTSERFGPLPMPVSGGSSGNHEGVA